jgi:non-ribosomal peptide synthetase component E (peptide arylation enzyme)
MSSDATLAGVIAGRATFDPDGPALIHDGASVSFGELDQRVRSTAAALD